MELNSWMVGCYLKHVNFLPLKDFPANAQIESNHQHSDCQVHVTVLLGYINIFNNAKALSSYSAQLSNKYTYVNTFKTTNYIEDWITEGLLFRQLTLVPTYFGFKALVILHPSTGVAGSGDVAICSSLLNMCDSLWWGTNTMTSL